jgi:predicted ribosome quality control (RQC) complex YloA/Tae2 family protein
MRQLTSFDLHYLIAELKLEGAKIDKFYMSENEEIILSIHIPNTGKRMLRMAAPNMLFLTEQKEEMPEKPKSFVQFLRKHLSNARIRSVQQIGFERTVEITCTTKEGTFRLIMELFGKGNIILCDDDMQIVSALQLKKWSDREIKGGLKYEYPRKEANFLTITEDELKEIYGKSELSTVKFLAIELGLGGIFAEEVCLRAGIDKSKNDSSFVKPLFQAISSLRSEKPKPMLIIEDVPVDFAPVELKLNEGKDRQELPAFNELLDKLASEAITIRESTRKNKARLQEIERLRKIIAMQEESIAAMQKEADEMQAKGEAIYHHYSLISEILEEIAKARKKFGLREIKAKLKGHHMIKGLNEEKKEITVEF